MIPRIQGKVGQALDGPHVGKWFFEMWMTAIGAGEGESLGQYGPWKTEEEAHQQLREACRLACENIEMQMAGKTSGKYIDMTTNTVRNWDEH